MCKYLCKKPGNEYYNLRNYYRVVDGVPKYNYKEVCEDGIDKEKIKICRACGRLFHGSVHRRLFNNFDGYKESGLCPTCFLKVAVPKKGNVCSFCGGKAYQTTGYTQDLSDVVVIDRSVTNEHGIFCPRCADNVARCGGCGDLIEKTNILTDTTCMDCVPVFYPILPYTYVDRNPKHFRSKGDSKETWGIELEFAIPDHYNREKVAHFVQSEMNPEEIFCVHDGDVRQGFEIVSRPMSLEYLQQSSMTKVFSLMDKYAPGWREVSAPHQQCGLHVHVGREFIHKLDLLKILMFCYSNKTFMETVARRRLNNKCGVYSARKFTEHIKKEGKNYVREERYTMVNLTNPHTVEFRMFHCGQDLIHLWQAIEFVKAIREYATNTSLCSISVLGFKHFVSVNRKEYKYLQQLIAPYVPFEEPTPGNVQPYLPKIRRLMHNFEQPPAKVRLEPHHLQERRGLMDDWRLIQDAMDVQRRAQPVEEL